MTLDSRRRLSKRKREHIQLTRVFLDGVDLDGACVKADARRGLVVCYAFELRPDGSKRWQLDEDSWPRGPKYETRRGRVTFHKWKPKRKAQR